MKRKQLRKGPYHINAVIDEDIAKRAKAQAALQGISMARYIEIALAEWLAVKPKK